MIIPSPEVPFWDSPSGGLGPHNWPEGVSASPSDPSPWDGVAPGPWAEGGQRSLQPVNCGTLVPGIGAKKGPGPGPSLAKSSLELSPPFAPPVAAASLSTSMAVTAMQVFIKTEAETIAVRC